MSFREKRALITLIAVWIVAVGYFASVVRAAPISLSDATPGLICAAVSLIAIMILSHIVLVIGAGVEEALQAFDERDRLVQQASRRNMGWIGIAGLWLVLILVINMEPHLVIEYVALGAATLAEMVMYGSQLIYYRRRA